MHDKHRGMHENSHYPVSRGKKKKKKESDMISTSSRESVISPLLLVFVLCGYQIYQFLKRVYDLFKPEFHM